MRAVFHITVPQNTADGSFPNDTNVREWLKGFGWEPSEIANITNEVEKAEKHKNLCLSQKSDLPEIAEKELESAIFFGVTSQTQSHIIVTRANVGELAFRVINEKFMKLTLATEFVVTKIIDNKKWIMEHTNNGIINESVTLYEKKSSNSFFIGRVIENYVLEAKRINKKDFWISIVSFISLIFLIPIALLKPEGAIFAGKQDTINFIEGSVDRLSTALFAALIISAIGIINTYIDIRSHKRIKWDPHRVDGE